MLIIAFIALALSLLIISAACRQANKLAPASGNNPSVSTAVTAKPEKQTNLRSDIGFASRKKWLDHFDKHGSEFGNITADEYLRQAQTLRDRAVGGDLLESVRRDGVVTRFDKESGAFLAFDQDLTIRTYFKPNDGASYFWRQSKR